MAIDQSAVWEMRTAGSNLNGGFFTSGGTDYSQQAAAQFTASDAITNGTTTVNFPTGTTPTLDATCEGNGIYLSNTGERYEIITFTDANNVVVDRAVTTGSGITANIGGAVALPTAALDNDFVAGNLLWIKNDGTYNLTGNISGGTAGTTGKYIRKIGYNTTRGDNPSGDNRILISAGTNTISLPAQTTYENVRFTTTSTTSFISYGTDAKLYNCSVTSNRGAGSIWSVISLAGELIGCEVTTPDITSYVSNGAIISGAACSVIRGCNIHDCSPTDSAVYIAHANLEILFNTLDTNYTGIEFTAVGDSAKILNNTIYNCSQYGIDAALSDKASIRNNDFNSNGTAVRGGVSAVDVLDYNNYYDNSTDVLNATKGLNATANDPNYTDAANGDFTNTLSADDSDPYLYGGGFKPVQGAYQPSFGSEQSYGYAG